MNILLQNADLPYFPNAPMPTPIEPKSEIRLDHSITVGLAEVPGFVDENGSTYWGLPAGQITYSRKRAEAVAHALNNILSRHHPSDLMKSKKS